MRNLKRLTKMAVTRVSMSLIFACVPAQGQATSPSSHAVAYSPDYATRSSGDTDLNSVVGSLKQVVQKIENRLEPITSSPCAAASSPEVSDIQREIKWAGQFGRDRIDPWIASTEFQSLSDEERASLYNTIDDQYRRLNAAENRIRNLERRQSSCGVSSPFLPGTQAFYSPFYSPFYFPFAGRNGFFGRRNRFFYSGFPLAPFALPPLSAIPGIELNWMYARLIAGLLFGNSDSSPRRSGVSNAGRDASFPTFSGFSSDGFQMIAAAAAATTPAAPTPSTLSVGAVR